MEKGDTVRVVGKLKGVVDFLAAADDDTMKLLYSFLQEKDPHADARLLQKSLSVNKVYKNSVEVMMSKGYVFEEKKEYFELAVSSKSKIATIIKESKKSLDKVPTSLPLQEASVPSHENN
jgi:hypothetical protein